MDSKNFIRFLSFTFVIILLLLLTLTNLPLTNKAIEQLDCATNSPRCNRFIKQPPKPTARLHTSDVPHHPLDPLTLTELTKTRSILLSHPLFANSNTYALHSVVLEEPDKFLVQSWDHGNDLPPRRASVIARVNGKTHVFTVDIATGVVTPLDVGQHSGYPTMTIEDMTSSTWAPLENADFNRTIMARGIDLKDLACLPISLGWYGKKEENRRLIKVQCYSMEGTANFYMRPIEGLTVVLDMDTQQVIEITDKGTNIPIPKAAGTDYRFSAQNKKYNLINPISLEQPKGPSFVVENDHLVKWANWEFHLKPDPRAGVVISRAMVRDPNTGEKRNVMYKRFTSELFKTYMDAGEYGFGLQAIPLDPLNDCPRNAYYMDGVFAAGDGKPYVRSNMVCVYESYAGDLGWRHSESPITGMEILEKWRPKVTLVVRMAASVANYDYILDWEFQNDGLVLVKETTTIP